jgi:hypothetical protein
VIPINDWVGNFTEICGMSPNIFTNADTGTLVYWNPDTQQPSSSMAITTGLSASLINAPGLEPVLQAQDGSFIGVGGDSTQSLMGAFDTSGNVRWTVAGDYYPQIATADGGVIAIEGGAGVMTFDQNGNATGQMGSLPTYSWLGYQYQGDPLTKVRANPIDFGLSFAAFFDQAGPPANKAAVKLVQSKMFLPAEINTTAQVNTDFYNLIRKNIASTQIALDLLVKDKATEFAFNTALDTTNMVVNYIGHGLVFVGQPGASGLCFAPSSKTCLVPKTLYPGDLAGATEVDLQDGTKYVILENGFAPKAKIVIVAACEIDANFIGQWHLKPGQALIVPVYSNPGEAAEIDLTKAAYEVQSMLLTLAQGLTVNAALAVGNQSAVSLNAAHRWQVIGSGNVTIR